MPFSAQEFRNLPSLYADFSMVAWVSRPEHPAGRSMQAAAATARSGNVGQVANLPGMLSQVGNLPHISLVAIFRREGIVLAADTSGPLVSIQVPRPFSRPGRSSPRWPRRG